MLPAGYAYLQARDVAKRKDCQILFFFVLQTTYMYNVLLHRQLVKPAKHSHSSET